jgi:hypothetical protein
VGLDQWAEFLGGRGHRPTLLAVLTSARTAALIGSGRSGQAATTSAKSESPPPSVMGLTKPGSGFGSAPVSQDTPLSVASWRDDVLGVSRTGRVETLENKGD